jgi:hypothetical protein
MRSPAEGITLEPPNSFQVLAWADGVAIRFILVLVVLIGGSWSKVFSAAVGEWDVFHGSIDPAATARHYAVTGLVFFATKEFALDFRAGAGLNAQANRFLIGTGFAFRH